MSNFARYIQGDQSIDYTPGSAVTAGQVVVLADLIGVAKLDIAANVKGALALEGTFDFPKATTGGSALAVGTTVYWNSDSNVAQAAASTYKQLGKVARAAVDADTTVRIVLNGLVTSTFNPLTANIADPGNAGAIPVTASGFVELVTAAAETRTLAAPTIKGQQILLTLKTDGGDCVVTAAATVNQAGNNTITFNDAGDTVLLVAKISGANLKWSVVSNDGATLTTV